jgi:hypothetical protein
MKYVPFHLDLLTLWHKRAAIHKEAVFTSGSLFLPRHLTVVDEGIVAIILLNLLSALLLPLASLRLDAVGTSARTAHGNITVKVAVAIYIKT